MKTQLLILLFPFIPILSFSQNWANYNSEWHYNQINFFTPPNLSYIKFEAIGDTLINGDSVKIILEENVSFADTVSKKIFMKSDSDKVYLYVPEISAYKLIYDFAANTGDTIEVFCRQAFQDSTIKVHVDSISTLDINNNALRVQYVSQIDSEGDEYYMEGEIIENIGWTGFMFPLHAWADPPYGGPLRCFQNDIIGLYKLTEIDCDYVTSTKIISTEYEIKLYPNPAKNYITVTCPSNIKIQKIELFDTSGRNLKTWENMNLSGSKLSIENVIPGIYFLKMETQLAIKTEVLVVR